MVRPMKKIISWLYSLKTDKCLHFIAGMVVAQIAFALLRLALPWWWSAFIAFVIAVVVGGLKEAWDIKHGVPNVADFVATMLGGLVGVSLAIPIAL